MVSITDNVRTKTRANLMAAYSCESNARAKYLAYAQKADREGYGKVADLFRAAAESEKIELNNQALVIQAMGGTPRTNIKHHAIRSTRKNLVDAKNEETYETAVMYPQFIAQAQKEDNEDAVRMFTYARAAEVQHVKFYEEALDNLNEWKSGKTEFRVCPICGYTVQAKPVFLACPVCATPTRLYESPR